MNKRQYYNVFLILFSCLCLKSFFVVFFSSKKLRGNSSSRSSCSNSTRINKFNLLSKKRTFETYSCAYFAHFLRVWAFFFFFFFFIVVVVDFMPKRILQLYHRKFFLAPWRKNSTLWLLPLYSICALLTYVCVWVSHCLGLIHI